MRNKSRSGPQSVSLDSSKCSRSQKTPAGLGAAHCPRGPLADPGLLAGCLYRSVQTAATKYHRVGGLEIEMYCLWFWRLEVQFQGPAWLGSREGTLVSQVGDFSLYPHLVGGAGQLSEVSFIRIRTPVPFMKSPPS